MELWGGLECTINRVGDQYMDQLEYSGHYSRPEDLQSFSDLGIKKLRYPILWEKHEPEKDGAIDWTLSEDRLLRLKELGIEPIAGLVHHGSGPAFVHIMEESFVSGLASYAAKVARKFPWIKYYTPVNEPLTTARFCGLYGHWFPHLHDAASFIRILINECKATARAMQEIRKINPGALLVQTEDLGKIHSTPLLRYQADFENNRRWLSIDLLCGKVDRNHYLWDYLMHVGIDEKDLVFFRENPCPPDILGFNYYITSERFLDERIQYYPSHTHGGNNKHQYADVEVVRVASANISGPYILLKEAWERFHIPLAITEVHLHCTRDEQLRWFKFVWDSAAKLESEKIDIRGVTTWAMIGSFGWNKLLKEPNGTYEPGIFDVLSGKLRPTALCKMISLLASEDNFDHPVLKGKGWWERDTRIIYDHDRPGQKEKSESKSHSPLLIIGKTGTLGNAFARVCEVRNISYKLLGKPEFDLTDPQKMEEVIKEIKPWAIINTAGFVRVDEAEDNAHSCFLSNSTGPLNLSVLCRKYNIRLVTFSSDLVFDGRKNDFYIESDHVNPLNIYGKSKARAEQDVLLNTPDALVIRTSSFFGPWDQHNFVYHVCKALKDNLPFRAANDIFISPTYTPDLANTTLDLLIDEEYGIWHLTNNGSLSWYDLACKVADCIKRSRSLIIPVPSAEMGYKAARPNFSALKSSRGHLLPTIDNALNQYFSQQLVVA